MFCCFSVHILALFSAYLHAYFILFKCLTIRSLVMTKSNLMRFVPRDSLRLYHGVGQLNCAREYCLPSSQSLKGVYFCPNHLFPPLQSKHLRWACQCIIIIFLPKLSTHLCYKIYIKKSSFKRLVPGKSGIILEQK